jgi:hypothetical protein
VAGFWPKAEKGEKLFSFNIFCLQNPLQCLELFLVFKLVLEHSKYGMDLSAHIIKSINFYFKVSNILSTFQNRGRDMYCYGFHFTLNAKIS